MNDSADSAENLIDNAQASGTYIQWSCHPVKRRPMVSLLVTVFVLVLIGVVYSTTNSVGFAILTFVIMSLSLAKFYFPTRYRLDNKGVTVKTTTHTLHKAWSEFRSAYPDKNGILLSPFAEPSRLENFRGMFIMFENNRDEVISFVNGHIALKSKKTSEGETG